MVKIRKALSNNNNHFGRGNPANFITVHETGNFSKGANAEMHRRYVNNGSVATWHYTVDDKEAVKHYDHNIMCWHAGDGRGKGNTQSIGIEICVNSDGNYLEALNNTIELIRKIMKDENIPINNVVQHNYWSGKNCPQRLRGGNHGMNWNQFKNKIMDQPNKSKNKKLYRVQVGAFRNYVNARNLRTELISKGYKDTFITDDTLYRVQVGAFSNINNAKKLRDELVNQGYKGTFIK